MGNCLTYAACCFIRYYIDTTLSVVVCLPSVLPESVRQRTVDTAIVPVVGIGSHLVKAVNLFLRLSPRFLSDSANLLSVSACIGFT